MRFRQARSGPVRAKLMILALFFVVAATSAPSGAYDTTESVEQLIRCSDIVVLAKLTETLHYGIAAGPGAMVYTRHLLRVENYYVGSGPQDITLLTPGGILKQPDGTETLTSIAYGAGAWGPGLIAGESFLSFLQVFAPGYVFVNRRHSCWWAKVPKHDLLLARCLTSA